MTPALDHASRSRPSDLFGAFALVTALESTS